MPLKPYVPIGWSKRLTNVRIYLDDVDQALSDLSEKGNTRLVATHKDGRLSSCEKSDDLIGREDIAGLIVMLVTSNERERVSIEVDSSAVRVDVGTNRHDIKVVVEGFIESLERVKPIKFIIPALAPSISVIPIASISVREGTYNRVQLILDRRITAFQSRQQRRHNLFVSVVSGVAGAVLGAVATIAVAVLGKS